MNAIEVTILVVARREVFLGIDRLRKLETDRVSLSAFTFNPSLRIERVERVFEVDSAVVAKYESMPVARALMGYAIVVDRLKTRRRTVKVDRFTRSRLRDDRWSVLCYRHTCKEGGEQESCEKFLHK